MINNKNYIDTFRDNVAQQLTLRATDTTSDHIALLDKLLKNKDYLFADLFYKISKDFNLEIDNLCKDLFISLDCERIEVPLTKSTRVREFLSPFMLEQRDIYKLAKINKSRLSRIINSENDVIYAQEVYGLAIAFGITPSSLFEYLYGDGERPLVGL